MSIEISALPSAATLTGAELAIVVQSGTTSTTTVALAGAYAEGLVEAWSTVTPPVSGDLLLGTRSGVGQQTSINDLATFIVGGIYAASAVTPALTGDVFSIARSGALKTLTIDTLTTYVLAGAQAGILNISSLGSATLGSGDYYLVVQGSTAKQTTLAALETKVYADFNSYVTGLGADSTVAGGDVLYVIQSSTAKNVTAVALATYVQSAIASNVVALVFASTTISSFSTGDVLPLSRSSVPNTGTIDMVASFVIGVLGASMAVSPWVTGDVLPLYRSGAAKTATVDNLAAFSIATLWAANTLTSVLDTDKLILGRSGTNQITAANFKTYVLTGIQASVLNISGLASATLGSTDNYLVVQSGVATQTTLAGLEAKVYADFETYVAGLSDAATLADADKLYAIQSTTPKYTTALEVSTYTAGKLWASSAATSTVTGDKLLMSRSGTMMTVTVDYVAAFVITGAQAGILNISGLSTASISGTDLTLDCSGTTANKVTFAAVSTFVYSGMTAYVQALPPVAALDGTEQFCTLQGNTPKLTTMAEIADFALGVQSTSIFPWQTVPAAHYTATPLNGYTLTMSNTTGMVLGLPVAYTFNSTTYYGQILAVTANTSITIVGPALNGSYPLTALWIGIAEQVEQLDIFIPGAWAASVQDVLAAVAYRYFTWKKKAASLVVFGATQGTADTGASQPKVNVKIAGNLVGTDNSNAGLLLSATPGTEQGSSYNGVSATNYTIAFNDPLEISCTSNGTNHDAANLTVSLVFVHH